MAVATRIIGDASCIAVITLFDMAAKRSRPACRDGTHDAPLHATEMAGMGMPKSFAVAAEYIRHLQGRRHGGGSAGRHDFQSQPVQWTWRVADGLGGNLGVTRRACQVGMSEQHLDDTHV